MIVQLHTFFILGIYVGKLCFVPIGRWSKPPVIKRKQILEVVLVLCKVLICTASTVNSVIIGVVAYLTGEE